MTELEKSTDKILDYLGIYSDSNVKKMYHLLAKVYHPDNQTGNNELFNKINNINNDINNYIKNNSIHKYDNIDFEQEILFLLKQYNITIHNVEEEIKLFDLLKEYETILKNDAAFYKLSNIYDKIKRRQEGKDDSYYKNDAIKKINNYYTFNMSSYLNTLNDERIKTIILRYMVNINDLVSNTTSNIMLESSNDKIDYLVNSFKEPYSRLIHNFFSEYLTYTNLNMKEKKEVIDNIDFQFKNNYSQMNLLFICMHLNDFLKINRTEATNEYDASLKSEKNKVKGLLNQILKNKYINDSEYYDYSMALKEAENINDVKNLYQDLYFNFYYKNQIQKVKRNVMLNFNKCFNNSHHFAYLTCSEVLYQIYDIIENKTLSTNAMNYLNNIDFNDIAEINTFLKEYYSKEK